MSRNDGQSTPLRRRPSRTVPASIVGILLLAAGVALVWLTVARLMDGTWSTLLQGPRDWLAVLAWNGPDVWGVGIAAVVVGLILLLCALIPGRFNALTVRDADDAGVGVRANERETVMTSRAVAQVAKAQCARIDGVRSASATATDKRVHLSVKTSLRNTGDLSTRVTDGVRERLNAIGLDPVPHVTATVESKR
ncbi:hypothetical protein BJG92_02884 [Arthrobacter sp. SO5]|uniref:DUF6286 domain-containing protein n=1 Tax=Arthrobacter sp. SO5 TaxID=1897055 RepID=UPI001E4B5744|nr:DUF6286 domain-containing protein [Arthrobacter sp. SO5]MCB5275336.1 hypothetical protein [Arthrobacter sp. SO5]